MKKNSIKKLVSAMALSLSLALTVPTVLPAAQVVTTVEAASAKLSATKKTVLAGQSFKLTVKNKGKNKVKWSSSKSSIASVNSKGTVTAKKSGKATIKAKVGKKTLKCTVTVKSNAYTYKCPSVSDTYFFPNGYTYTVPTKVQYVNGKLECTSKFINKQTYYTIKKISKSKTSSSAGISYTLKARVYSKPTYATYKDTTIAKGTIKKGLPTNIGYGKSKNFKVTFSGSQIKKKGFDLTVVDDMVLDPGTCYLYK